MNLWPNPNLSSVLKRPTRPGQTASQHPVRGLPLTRQVEKDVKKASNIEKRVRIFASVFRRETERN